MHVKLHQEEFPERLIKALKMARIALKKSKNVKSQQLKMPESGWKNS